MDQVIFRYVIKKIAYFYRLILFNEQNKQTSCVIHIITTTLSHSLLTLDVLSEAPQSVSFLLTHLLE